MNLSENTSQLLQLFDLVPMGILVSSGRIIVHCNNEFTNMFGYDRSELIGMSLEGLYPSRQEYQDVGDHWVESMRINGECSDERVMKRKDGSLNWFRVRGRCESNSDPFSLAGYTFEWVRGYKNFHKMLTVRERQIVSAIHQGFTSKEIAKLLRLSPRTIETYRFRLMEKFQVKNINELIFKLMHE